MKIYLLLLCSFLVPHSFALATEYTFCADTVAYSDPGLTARDPGKDWICGLTPDASGARCPSAQTRACQGGTLPGPHDVPNGGIAWFWAQSANASQDVKCTCGCFIPHTLILTENGENTIFETLEAAKYQNVRVKVRQSLKNFGELRDSSPLRAKHFRVGAENKALVKLSLSNGRALEITEKHPVLVLRKNRQQMLQAHFVRESDVLLDEQGNEVAIVSIESKQLPEDSNTVINFASDEENPLAHLIVAEGVQVGDNRWQAALEVIKSRVDIRNSQELSYLDEIVGN